jgi:hypothetical protein
MLIVLKSRGFTPLFEKDDCRSYITEGRGRFIKQIPLAPPFSKGEVVFDEILSAAGLPEGRFKRSNERCH